MATLNRTGRDFALGLIEDGNVDTTSAWTFTAADGSALLGDAGDDWANYGRFHLGINAGENFDTKQHWEYPFGKEGKVFRSALVAIRARATQQRDNAVFDAAGQLLDEIDGDTDRTNENSVDSGPKAIVINARPPRIEIQPRMDMGLESAPIDDAVMAKWNPGLRAQNSSEKNVIQILDVIGEDFWSGGGITAQSIADQLEAIGPNPLEVHINSPGGDMFEGIAIYNVLRDHPAAITVKVMALAASAASVIAMAGNQILVSPSSFIMIHNAWVIAMGNRHDFAEVAAYLEPFDFALRDIYVAKSGQKADQVMSWMDDDTYMNGTMAIERKFATALLPADQVTEDKGAAARGKNANALRKIEAYLVRKGGMTRSQARALIKESHVGKRDAADANGTKQNAGADVMPGADARTVAALRSLIETLNA